jgi:hypothetical protein
LKLCWSIVVEKITTHAEIVSFILTSHLELVKAWPTKSAGHTLMVARISPPGARA